MSLTTYFESFNLFSQDELTDLYSLFKPKYLQKLDFFAHEGQSCSEIAFIESGIIRSFYTTKSGEEHTYCFRFPNDLVAAYSAFITGEKSSESLQAISPCRLLVIQKSSLEQLFKSNVHWIQFLKEIAESNYLELEQRVFSLQKQSAIERYETLLKHQSSYVQTIPLHYLASYLGITQRHLSRIRKELSV